MYVYLCLFVIGHLSKFKNLVFLRLQLYDLIENKVQGDGNCQVGSLFLLLGCSSIAALNIYLLLLENL